MKLFVVITGLVLLAPDPAGRRIHLLFPEVHGHGEMAWHVPSLEYSPFPGSGVTSLDGWALDLGGVARAGNALSLPGEIMALNGAFPGGLPRGWIGETPPPRLRGRVSLPWPDAVTVRRSARWTTLAGARRDTATLASEVVLHYDAASMSTEWTLRPLAAGVGGIRTLPLPRQPPQRGDTLRISHLPVRAGEELRPGDEGVHFQGYVDLLLSGEHPRERPRVYLHDARARGFSPFNCMLAWLALRP